MRAWSLIRSQPVYRSEAFVAGLKAAGIEYVPGEPKKVRPGDLLLTWNRYLYVHEVATDFERQGGVVVVCENGYVGPGGLSPHDQDPREWFAMAVGGHNGSGTINVGGPERWESLGVTLAPWRATGDHVLVCPNRPFGKPGTAMPSDWQTTVIERLRKETDRPIRVRSHPGNSPASVPINRDLENAYACVIWSSSVGVQALIRGVPVVCCAPYWVAKSATTPDITSTEIHQPERLSALCSKRRNAMYSLAWAQWHISEIEIGRAFEHLLEKVDTCT